MDIVHFDNKVLEKSVLKQIKAQKSGFSKLFLNKITKEDIHNISELTLKNMELKNLDFLKQFPHLKSLVLMEVTGIQDIRGVEHCPNLECFACYDTGIDDLSPVRNCRELTLFDYLCEKDESAPHRRKEKDFAFLQELPTLEEVDLWGNLVEDISFLAECANLEMLVLTKNPINTIAPLKALQKLDYLEVTECGLKELEDIEQFPALTMVYAEDNLIPKEKGDIYRQTCTHIECFEL